MSSKVSPPQYQVFVNFRGHELRNNFISHLVDALKRNEINIFTDKQEQKGENISNLFNRIEESKIVLAVFSKRYTESRWCLDELVKIKERADLGELKVLPIFYNVTTYEVKMLEGDFGIHFRRLEWEYRSEQPKIDKWKEALACVSGKIGLTLCHKSLPESVFIGNVVDEVLILLQAISSVQTTNSSVHKLPEKVVKSSTKKSLKAQKGNPVMSPPKAEIGNTALAPRDDASGQGMHMTIEITQTATRANTSRVGVPPRQGPYNTADPPSHSSGDAFPVRYGSHKSAVRGDSSSTTNNSKKPLKLSERNVKNTVKDGWPSHAGPVQTYFCKTNQ